MSKRKLLSFQAIASIIVLCVVLCLSPKSKKPCNPDFFEECYETVVTVDETAAPIEESCLTEAGHEFTDAELNTRFTTMLNLNQCYNESFSNIDTLVSASAISLFDYSVDIPDYGFCINTSLIQGFAKSFYGITLNNDDLTDTNAPEGFLAVPLCETGTQSHTVCSITFDGEGYDVWSTVVVYYGGDNTETYFARSYFIPDNLSEFEFNLVSCETL